MKMTGGAIVTRALEDEGVELAFGIPGTHNIELYDALAESRSVRVVPVTDEQSASFMADAVWRASGRLACVNVVPGAGLTHALSGIAEAFLDNVAMLVLGCGIRRDQPRAFQLHDVDQLGIAGPVVKRTFLVGSGAELYDTVRRACALARSGSPGPVFVEVPVELYLFTHDVTLSSPGNAGRPRAPSPVDGEAVSRAADLIRAARRPLVYAGAGAVGAADHLLRLAEALDAPVSTTFQGKGVFPEEHPLFLWPGFGRTAPAFARRIADRCDLTIAIGCRFSEVGTGSYALEPKGPLIHVDIDPDVFDRNFPAEVAIAADAAAFFEELWKLPELDHRSVDEGVRSEIREGHAGVWKDWLDDVGGERVSPVHLLRSAQHVFGPDTVYTADSGNGTFLAMEMLRLDRPRCFLAPVDYSCMGYSVPAAIGAKLACPDRPVVALAGDGAFLMTGLETLTAVQEGVGAVILVLRDGELAQIAQIQDTAFSRKTASSVHGYRLRHLASAVGAPFLSLERDEDVEEILTRARDLALDGSPVLVEVAIDYSRKTHFTKGVMWTNLSRLPLKDRARFVGRALTRKLTG